MIYSDRQSREIYPHPMMGLFFFGPIGPAVRAGVIVGEANSGEDLLLVEMFDEVTPEGVEKNRPMRVIHVRDLERLDFYDKFDDVRLRMWEHAHPKKEPV
jgi:hypothetical protein